MASPITGDNDTFSRDPFRLDRLADELATRESVQPPLDSADDLVGVSLPEYTPLSHEDAYLTAEVFNVEEFLMSRSRTSLPDLRVELRQYLATLKEELVQLINDDYEAFISLSTDLRDEGARLERLKQPLGNLKTLVLVSINSYFFTCSPKLRLMMNTRIRRQSFRRFKRISMISCLKERDFVKRK